MILECWKKNSSKTEKKERKRNRGLREKQKATIGVGELREEMGREACHCACFLSEA